jgi:hypothetical protein
MRSRRLAGMLERAVLGAAMTLVLTIVERWVRRPRQTRQPSRVARLLVSLAARAVGRGSKRAIEQ